MTSRALGTAVSPASTQAALPVPSDSVYCERAPAVILDAADPTTMDGLRSMISGLLAIGVDPKEAFASLPGASPNDLAGVACELVRDGKQLVEALYCICQNVPVAGRKEFGRMLLSDHGINPISVAMAVETVDEVKGLAIELGVELWIVDGIKSTNTHDRIPSDLAMLSVDLDRAPMTDRTITIPGRLVLSNLVISGKAEGMTILCDGMEILGHLDVRETDKFALPVLAYVGGDLSAGATNGLTLPVLASVGKDLNAPGATNLVLPALKSAGRDFNARATTNLVLPALVSVGGHLDAETAVNLSLPVLATVGRWLDADDTTNLSLPALMNVGGWFSKRDATNLLAPALKTVNGNPYVGGQP